MTLDISNVITVSITRQTQFPVGPGFGTLMILSPNIGVIPLVERFRKYSSIDGVASDFSTTDEEYKSASAYFSQNPRPTDLVIATRDIANPLGDELDVIVEATDDWYAFVLTAEARISDGGTLSEDAAAWAEPRIKLFVTASNEAAAIAAGGGLPGTLATSNYDRSMVFYHQLAELSAGNRYPEASFLGSMLTVDFDGAGTVKTGKFKNLPGIEVSDLTETQLAFLLANAGNAFVDIAGNDMTLEGTMASGEFFDIMHGVDWLQAEIANRVYGKLATLPVVPYTNRGMAILGGEVTGALQQGVTNGLLSAIFDDDTLLLDAFTVTVPNVLSASDADRAARIAPPIAFTAQLSGAIHFATVNGTVTV